jgi:hypothetical protein
LIAGKRQRRDRLLESSKPDVKTLERLAAEIELLRTEARVLQAGDGAAAAGAAPDTQPSTATDASWKLRPDVGRGGVLPRESSRAGSSSSIGAR